MAAEIDRRGILTERKLDKGLGRGYWIKAMSAFRMLLCLLGLWGEIGLAKLIAV